MILNSVSGNSGEDQFSPPELRLMFLDYFALAVTAVVAGLTVSLDVSVLTLTSGIEHIRKFGLRKWSLTHAFWHAFFLSIGLGVFHAIILLLGKAMQLLMPQMVEFFEKVILRLEQFSALWADLLISILQFIQGNLAALPEFLGALFAVVLCLYFYRKKIRIHAGEIEEKDIGFSSYFSRLSELNYLGVLVAMDMWYLTPTLRNLVIDPSDSTTTFQAVIQAVFFIGVLFSVVYGFVYFVSCIAKRASDNVSVIEEDDHYVQCIARYALIVLEPLGVFYFVSYAVHRVLSESAGHSSVHILVSVAVVSVLLHGRNAKIIYAIVRDCRRQVTSPPTD